MQVSKLLNFFFSHLYLPLVTMLFLEEKVTSISWIRQLKTRVTQVPTLLTGGPFLGIQRTCPCPRPPESKQIVDSERLNLESRYNTFS